MQQLDLFAAIDIDVATESEAPAWVDETPDWSEDGLVGPDGEWLELDEDAGMRPLFYPGGPDPDPERLGGWTREEWAQHSRRTKGCDIVATDLGNVFICRR